MHHDGLIKDRTTEIKGDRGPHDVGLCPLFVRDMPTVEEAFIISDGPNRAR